MIRFLISTLFHLLANATGLLIAAVVLAGFSIGVKGFVVATLLFTVIEAIVGPFAVSVSKKYATTLTGGVALVSTLVGLIITSIFVEGLQIDSLGDWLAATVIVWLAAVLAGLVLPLLIFRKVMKPNSNKSAKTGDA